MKPVARFAPWINRLVLVAAALVFTRIGLRYVVDPVRTLAAIGVTVGPGHAAAAMRVGSGGFPLACAIFCLGCLSSIHRLTAGVGVVVAVMTTFIALRLFSLGADGMVPESLRLMIPEAVILVLSLAGLVLEAARMKQENSGTA